MINLKIMFNNVKIMPRPGNDSREFCGLCHFKMVARPSEFPQIDPESGHGEDLKCTYCHNPHKPMVLINYVIIKFYNTIEIVNIR